MIGSTSENNRVIFMFLFKCNYVERNMTEKPLAMIFDVDGTLADTERDGHRVAFNKAFTEAGLDWCWSVEQYGKLLRITGGQERMKGYLLDNPINNIEINDIEKLIAGLHKQKNRFYDDIVRSGETPLRSGVERLLNEGRQQGVRLAIATTTTRSNVVALLEANLGPDSLGWFEVIATADEVPDKKPSPAVYDYVLDKMGLSASDCLVLEDSQNGLRAAHAANLPTLVTINSYTQGDDLTGAELVIDQFGEPDDSMTVIGGSKASRLSAGTNFIDMQAIRQIMHD